MADFGWSAACIVEAIKLTNKARKALKDAGGATSQYEDATTFLTSLNNTLDLLKQHLDNLPDESYVTAIRNHMGEIDAPWAEFKSTLDKYKKSLAADSTRSKTKQAPRKIQWAAKEVDEAARKLRERVMQPIQAINCALALSILESIDISTNRPWTEAQCRKLLDGIHVADVPENLAQELSVLKTTAHDNGIQTAESIKDLKNTLSRIEELLAANSTESRTETTSEPSQSGAFNSPGDEDSRISREQQKAVLDTILAEIQRLGESTANREQTESKPRPYIWHMLTFSLGALLSPFVPWTSRFRVGTQVSQTNTGPSQSRSPLKRRHQLHDHRHKSESYPATMRSSQYAHEAECIPPERLANSGTAPTLPYIDHSALEERSLSPAKPRKSLQKPQTVKDSARTPHWVHEYDIWRCNECGVENLTENAPDKCPLCGADRAKL
ncbi:hypothetical protein K491DRAFT_711514 [Lophiostoma macrostomum CBS 122681]|uniref:Rubrerythrin rubredoxin-like domain-containing protein n=1 Tax=Lophiostoma macrostomum CBS 122681 TaxID=1314788 RepID=A0A6A6TN29_9PLEO|nr:hypothetical protein K491DRAFT_711514 [Lophiostoma macrostomum CBS 122681]